MQIKLTFSLSCKHVRMQKVCCVKQQISYLYITAAAQSFVYFWLRFQFLSACCKLSSASAGRGASTFRAKVGFWIRLIEAQTPSYFRMDQLAWPQGRRVQIDIDLLLLKHICQTEASPAARDRCWWSKLFSGDLRRLSKALNLFVSIESV